MLGEEDGGLAGKNTTKATPLLHAVSVTYRAFTLSKPAMREGVFLRARLDQCGVT